MDGSERNTELAVGVGRDNKCFAKEYTRKKAACESFFEKRLVAQKFTILSLLCAGKRAILKLNNCIQRRYAQ